MYSNSAMPPARENHQPQRLFPELKMAVPSQRHECIRDNEQNDCFHLTFKIGLRADPPRPAVSLQYLWTTRRQGWDWSWRRFRGAREGHRVPRFPRSAGLRMLICDMALALFMSVHIKIRASLRKPRTIRSIGIFGRVHAATSFRKSAGLEA